MWDDGVLPDNPDAGPGGFVSIDPGAATGRRWFE